MDKKEHLRSLLAAGWTVRKIRAATGLHTKTIARYRRQWAIPLQSDPQVSTDHIAPVDTFGSVSPPLPGQSDSQVSTEVLADPRLAITRSAQLEGLVEVIANLLDQAPDASARWVWQKLVDDHGYAGSDNSVRRYLRKLRKRSPQYFLRLSTSPGKEAQVDFAQGPMVLFEGKARRSWFFKMTLSHSRHSYEELVFRQDVETFLRCHENGFRSFAGVPAEVKLDNLKAGVLKACHYEPHLNPAYQAFAAHWGFLINPCDAYQPQQKGKVERDVRFTRHNAFAGVQVLPSLEAGNEMLSEWNRRWARTRIHGTTKRQVWEHFQSEELPALKPLADAPFSMLHQGMRRVDVHGHIQLEGCFYSVPVRHLRQEVLVRWDGHWVRIYAQEECVAMHRREHGKARVVSDPSHFPSGMPMGDTTFVQYYLKRAASIGPACHALAQRLLTGLNAGNPLAVKRMRGIVIDLNRRFGESILEEACRKAGGVGLPTWKTLEGICQKLSESDTAPPDPRGGDAARNGLQQEHHLIRSPDQYGDLVRWMSQEVGA
jgi:transposase